MRKTLLALALSVLACYFGGIARDAFSGAMNAHVAKLDRAAAVR